MIYLASPFFNEKQLNFVKKLEEAFTLAELQFFSPRSEGVLKDMTPEERSQRMLEIFDSNISHMNAACVIVAVIDNYDTGTVFEIGYGYGKDIPIFTITDNDYGLNVMVRECVTAHNKTLEGLIVNVCEHLANDPITINDVLTEDVT